MRARIAAAAAGVRRRAAARTRRGAVVLLYHRIATLARDPWDLAVTPATFEAHMAMLARRFQVLPLDALVAALAANRVPRHAVAVTFDDAYGDVVRDALPRLERHDVPATVFAVSGVTGSAREFWWDELEQLVLDGGALPAVLEIPQPTVGAPGAASTPHWHVPEPARAPVRPTSADRRWRAGDRDVPSARHAFYTELWHRLQPLDPEHRASVLDAIREQSGTSLEPRPDYLPCDAAALRTIARSTVGTVGAHTVSHPSLATLDAAAQVREIGVARDALTTIVGEPITLFAYPFGGRENYTPETVRHVQDAGYRGACINVRGVVRAGVSAYELPRLYVHECEAGELAWTIDAMLAAE